MKQTTTTASIVYEGKLTQVKNTSEEYVLQLTFDETYIFRGIFVKTPNTVELQTEFNIGDTYKVHDDGVTLYKNQQRYILENRTR